MIFHEAILEKKLMEKSPKVCLKKIIITWGVPKTHEGRHWTPLDLRIHVDHVFLDVHFFGISFNFAEVWYLSCYHFVVVSGLLTASPWRYTNETKILHTKWHIEYLLDMSNWLHDVHGGQGSQFCPFFHVFSLKRQSAPGTLRGPDTVNFHQASTLRLKGIHRHP